MNRTLLQITSRILAFSLLFAFVSAVAVRKGTLALSDHQGIMPTPNRLAEPTLPPSPSQADYGAQVYWLSCLPCHGDRGQGLTDEFREAYPPEDRNCWESGCHGERPYENGFQLPPKIPALIGNKTLRRFTTAATLQAYIFAAMPYWKPGSLTEEQSWQVTAFLLRENGWLQNRVELGPQNAAEILLPHATTNGATPTSSLTDNRLVSFPEGLLVVVGLVLLGGIGYLLGRRWQQN